MTFVFYVNCSFKLLACEKLDVAVSIQAVLEINFSSVQSLHPLALFLLLFYHWNLSVVFLFFCFLQGIKELVAVFFKMDDSNIP